jgi:Amidases related to nicotinamidase
MPASNQDLHGMVPDKTDVALLLIDVINDFDFPESEKLIARFRQVAPKIASLKKNLNKQKICSIYVNDNFKKWKSDFQSVLDHCKQANREVTDLVELLEPEADDYFILKPKHSGFYCSPLDILLEHLQAKTLILTGVAGNICVLFTANDAYMRGYKLLVPQDCIASNTVEDNDFALRQMKQLLKADLTTSEELVEELRKLSESAA